MRCMGGGLLLVVDEALDALEPCSALKESNEAEAPLDQGFRTAAAGRRVSRARPVGLLAWCPRLARASLTWGLRS